MVCPADNGARARAFALANELELPLVSSWSDTSAAVALVVDTDRAWLQQIEISKPPGPIFLDFASPAMEYRRKGGHNELLGRAVGVRGGKYPKVMDGTAGLGRDGFVLADLGCAVTLVERSRVLAWLLNEAVSAAMISASEHVRAAAARMRVRHQDSLALSVADQDVIYLDPMFPDRRSSAAVKKDLALLQALHGDSPAGATNLLEWALSQPVERIVVKRPAKSPALDSRSPSHSISGKAVRFDCYVR